MYVTWQSVWMSYQQHCIPPEAPHAVLKDSRQKQTHDGNINKQILCVISHTRVIPQPESSFTIKGGRTECYICFSFPLSFQYCAVHYKFLLKDIWCYVHSSWRPGWRNWKNWQPIVPRVLFHIKLQNIKLCSTFVLIFNTWSIVLLFEPNTFLFCAWKAFQLNDTWLDILSYLVSFRFLKV